MDASQQARELVEKAVDTAMFDILLEIKDKPDQRPILIAALDALPFLKAAVNKTLETIDNARSQH